MNIRQVSSKNNDIDCIGYGIAHQKKMGDSLLEITRLYNFARKVYDGSGLLLLIYNLIML